jgi:alkanesulfonate monooxygenase SsuD/methylene tetrahydromethanopterin reductase-like flavin-dependent oxidoreductase (luciferase family)
MDRLEEGAAVIRKLWSEELASFSGKVFTLNQALLNPKPAQNPAALLVGGSGEKRTLRVVARYADEWNMGAAPPERYRPKVEALEAHCEKYKRAPATVARSMMTAFCVGANEAEVRRRAERMQPVMPGRQPPPATSGPVEALRARGWLTGTPPQVIEQIKAHEAQGVSRLMLQHLDMSDFDSLELIAKEILPAVG